MRQFVRQTWCDFSGHHRWSLHPPVQNAFLLSFWLRCNCSDCTLLIPCFPHTNWSSFPNVHACMERSCMHLCEHSHLHHSVCPPCQWVREEEWEKKCISIFLFTTSWHNRPCFLRVHTLGSIKNRKGLSLFYFSLRHYRPWETDWPTDRDRDR